jgi:hypothetical protein
MKFILALIFVLSPVVCFALGGETYFEYRDGEVLNKFVYRVEFNQDLLKDRVRLWGAWKGTNLDYLNGTFIPSEEEYGAGIRYKINKELTFDVRHTWVHYPMQFVNGQYFSYRVTYTW